MSDNQYPNQQGYDPHQGYNPYQQITPQQGYNGPQQIYPDQGYPQYQYPPQSSADANKGVSGGKIVLIVVSIVLGVCILIAVGFFVLFNMIKKKAEAAMEKYTPSYTFNSEDFENPDEAIDQVLQELQDTVETMEALENVETEEDLNKLLEELDEDLDEEELNKLLDELTEESTEESEVTSSDEVVFTKDYFTSYQWEGLNDTALIKCESDGTFIWYRDRDDRDGDYYSGTYKLYIGDEAVTYLTTESEDKDNVTEDDIVAMEAPEYGATRENFVVLSMTNEVECYYGKETEYAPEDQITSNLYGYFVNDNDGYKLTLVNYGNPYEFNLVPKDKED